MDIKDLRYFCVTAEMQHVTKAAEKLGVSQPFLTRTIGSLEKELGFALFDNVGRKIRLNENGEGFYVHAKKVLLEFAELNQAVERMQNRRERQLRILCNFSPFSAEMVYAFKKEYPNYTTNIEMTSPKEILSALTFGEADFAFCSPPIPDDPEKGIKTELLFREKCCLLFPPDHPLIEKPLISFKDLADQHLIITQKDSGLRINVERVFKKYGFYPRIICETNDMDTIIRSVYNGVGYSIIPRWMLHASPNLCQYAVDVDLPEACAYIGITYNTNRDENDICPDFRGFALRFMSDFCNRVYNE